MLLDRDMTRGVTIWGVYLMHSSIF